MDWQQVTSLLIVGISAVLLAGSELRKRRLAKLRPCGHDCGCSTNTLKKIPRSIRKELRTESLNKT